MKRFFRAATIKLLAALTALTFAGCVGEVYPAGSATYASGGYYDYDYYPGPDIYFYPQHRIYYWNDGGHWRSGGRLPPRYHLGEEEREHLRLRSREPWTEHHEHRQYEPQQNRGSSSDTIAIDEELIPGITRIFYSSLFASLRVVNCCCFSIINSKCVVR